MTWSLSATPTVRGKLARHLGRLQKSLSAVGEQVREAVAKAVGRTVAEAVVEAVYEALNHPEGRSPSLLSSPPGYSARPQAARREWDDLGGQQVGGSHWPDDPYDQDDYDYPRHNDEPELEDNPSSNDLHRASRWGPVVAAGLQAAAWWLRRHSGRASVLAALALGAIAGLAVFADHVSGVAGLVASALGLTYLLDLVRSAGTVLDRRSAFEHLL